MAQRPIYMPTHSGDVFVRVKNVDFEWFPGMAKTQKQKSIASLHGNAKKGLNLNSILEVSSKSLDTLGVNLSAFNLKIQHKDGRVFSVENAFQSSKVFDRGGPFKDILNVSPVQAKRDPRLKESGNLKGFSFFGVDWPLQPVSAFYDYVYINALLKYPEIHSEIERFEGFTDIEFNPQKSLNCQAYALALFCSLKNRGLINNSISDKEYFLKVVSSNEVRVPPGKGSNQYSLF